MAVNERNYDFNKNRDKKYNEEIADKTIEMLEKAIEETCKEEAEIIKNKIDQEGNYQI